VRDRASRKGVREFPLHGALVDIEDAERLLFALRTPKGSLHFQAPSHDILDASVDALRRAIETSRSRPSAPPQSLHSIQVGRFGGTREGGGGGASWGGPLSCAQRRVSATMAAALGVQGPGEE